MVWRSDYASENYTPGDTRLRRTFAWWPKRINGDTVWLEKYETFQLYVIDDYQTNADGKPVIFKVAKWIDLSNRIIK